jgi:hypothetical protein
MGFPRLATFDGPPLQLAVVLSWRRLQVIDWHVGPSGVHVVARLGRHSGACFRLVKRANGHWMRKMKVDIACFGAS